MVHYIMPRDMCQGLCCIFNKCETSIPLAMVEMTNCEGDSLYSLTDYIVITIWCVKPSPTSSILLPTFLPSSRTSDTPDCFLPSFLMVIS